MGSTELPPSFAATQARKIGRDTSRQGAANRRLHEVGGQSSHTILSWEAQPEELPPRKASRKSSEAPQAARSDTKLHELRKRVTPMALHPDFPSSPHVVLDPEIRWFPADEALRETGMDKLRPPLVPVLRRKVKEFRDSGYVGATLL
jgi:hypothetical protein